MIRESGAARQAGERHEPKGVPNSGPCVERGKKGKGKRTREKLLRGGRDPSTFKGGKRGRKIGVQLSAVCRRAFWKKREGVRTTSSYIMAWKSRRTKGGGGGGVLGGGGAMEKKKEKPSANARSY